MRCISTLICICSLMVLFGCEKEQAPRDTAREGRKVVESPAVPVVEDVVSELHRAAENGDEALVKKLIADGADVNAQDEAGNTPLHFAAENGHLTIARILIEEGADMSLKNEFGFTPFQEAEQAQNEEMIQLFLSEGMGASVHKLIELGQTNLAAGKFDEVPEDVNLTDENDRTPLHVAAEVGDRGLVELLLVKEVDVNAKDKDGLTPLMVAIDNDHLSIAQLLLNEGADANVEDNSGRTALIAAIEKDSPELVEALVSNETDVNATIPDSGDSPLHYAVKASGKSVEMVQLLLSNGADPDVENKAGKTAMDIAVEVENGEVTPFLKVKMSESVRKEADAAQTKVADEVIEEATSGAVNSVTE